MKPLLCACTFVAGANDWEAACPCGYTRYCPRCKEMYSINERLRGPHVCAHNDGSGLCQVEGHVWVDPGRCSRCGLWVTARNDGGAS